ncbi:MAG TPA: outer membrane lipoprotein-sorting protein [Candidatus Binatia bacterium]|nr:outer membrane lipoprotein-sorting protein [Candidatus Binatia bacterium]
MSKSWRVWMLCALLAPALGRAESAREMLDQAKAINDAREPKDTSQRTKMILIDSRGGERVRDLEVYGKNYGRRTRKTIIFFLSPPEVKGVGFLSWSYPEKDDDQWLYLPELKRVRQISGATRKQSFQGSDFTYDDLDLFDDIRDWTEEDAASRLVREEEIVDGVPCAVIELVLQGKEYEYARFVLWLDRKDSTFRKIELYDKKTGALAKTLRLAGFETIGRVPTPHRIEMTNAKKGTKTILEASDVRYDRGLGDDVFTERTLERGKVD